MLQERLVRISTLSTEHEIAQNIDLKELVSTFAKLKVRKIKFKRVFNLVIFCIKQGCQRFRQPGHVERYNVLEHSNISTATNTKLNITI
jgi:hypothetical protein